MQNMSVSLLV